MDQVGTDTSLVLTIKLIKDFSPAVTLLPVLPPYVGNRNALRIITMYRVTDQKKRKILRVKVVNHVRNNYKNRDKVSKDVHHLFKESLEALCMKPTQYLSKWLETYRLSSGIKKRKGEIKKGRKDRKEK